MKKFLKLLFSILVLSSLSSCKIKEKDPYEQKDDIKTTMSSYSIMEGSIVETKAYLYTSNIAGPRVAIVGGIHGDETAGWKAAKELLKDDAYKGTFLIIPNANIIADTLVNRYPGATKGYISSSQKEYLSTIDAFKDKVEEIASTRFYDLNRQFPGDSSGNITQKLAAAIYNEIINFNPDYVIDLHESRHSHSMMKQDATYLGSLLIYGNARSSNTAWEITDLFNEKYLIDGEEEFDIYEGNVIGSFCNSIGKALPKSKVFTIETNREYDSVTATNTISEARRVEQQLQLLEVIFDAAYEEYASKNA